MENRGDIPAACVWCGSQNCILEGKPISRYRDAVYRFARCLSCGIKWAVPFNSFDLDYSAVQKAHRGYAILRANNEWIRSVLGNGPDAYWTQLAADYLSLRTLDARFVEALRQSIRAANGGKTL